MLRGNWARVVCGVGLALCVACGGTEATTPTQAVAVADPLAAIRGPWVVREVLFAQRQPPGIDCSDPRVWHSLCIEADTQAVAITAGTITIGQTVGGTRAVSASDGSASELVATTNDLTTIAYVGSTSAARASCSGKPVSCWTALIAVPVRPSLMSEQVLVATSKDAGAVAFWFSFNPQYATGQSTAFRTGLRLQPMPATRLSLYDSSWSSVFSLRKL